MKHRKLRVRMLSLVLSVLMMVSNSFIVHADGVAPFLPGGAYDGESIADPPKDEGGTLETYPNKGKSDNPADTANQLKTEWANKDQTTQESIELEDESKLWGSPTGGNKLGTHKVSIPALFVTVKYFNVSANIEKDIQKYLVSNALSKDQLNKAAKFISLDTIQKINGAYVIDEDYLRATVNKSKGFIVEDLFSTTPAGVTEADVTEARNIVLQHMYVGGTYELKDSYAYQTLAEVLYAYGAGSVFTQQVITDIDSVAESATPVSKTVPVILIYNGFLEYNSKTSGTASTWYTYSSKFGSAQWKKGFASVADYAKATLNKSSLKTNESYGSAAAIAFNDSNSYASTYYKKPSDTDVPYGLAGLNKFEYNSKTYYSRQYLMYGGTPTNKGADTAFTFNLRSTSGAMNANGKFVSGSSLKDYSLACGYFEVGLGGDTKTTQGVKASTRTWDMVIEISRDYPLANVNNNGVTALIDSVEIRNNSTNKVSAFVNAPVFTNDKITLKLTQAEMVDLIGNKTKVSFNIKPQYGSMANTTPLYTPIAVKVQVDNPKTDTLKTATPAKATSTGANAVYRVNGDTAYSYCMWKKSSSATQSGRNLDVDISLQRSTESDGVLDLSALSEASEDTEFEASEGYTTGERVARGGYSSIPFEFTYVGDKAYAEIVANEIGYVSTPKAGTTTGWAQDWSVLAGIPSTEAVSVAVGGTQYQVDAAGFINTETEITRTVNITMHENYAWGPDNIPCTLGDHSHQNHSPDSWDNTCSCHGGTPYTATCSHCGKTWTVPTHSADDNESTGSGENISYYHGHASSGVTQTCDCGSGSAGFSCVDGSYWWNGTMSGHVVLSPYLHHDQGWNGGIYWECNPNNGYPCLKGHSGVEQCVAQLIDEGYTLPGTYGNHCSYNWNMEHPHDATQIIKYEELIPTASWKEITSAKIYALGYSEITDVSETLYGTEYEGNSSSNANVLGLLWRGASGLVEGAHDISKGGHLWYTQFVDGRYSQTAAWATSLDTYYYLTDCFVTGEIVCDTRWANAGGDPTAYDTELIGPGGYISNYGYTHNDGEQQYKHHQGNPGTPQQYENGKARTGSKCESDYAHCKIPVDAMNAWLKTNAGYYKANIISDFLVMGVSQGNNVSNCFQNVIADFHAVDIDEGIPLYGIEDEDYWRCKVISRSNTVTIPTERVTHECKMDQEAGLMSGAYSMQTGSEPVVAGYIGVTDFNVLSDKYRARGTEGVDYKPYDECVSAFFFRDKWSGLQGEGAMPDSGGCKLTNGELDQPPKDSAPYGQWLWPDIEEHYEPAWNDPAWGWDLNTDGRDKYQIGDGINATGGLNHSESSGYTNLHFVTNGRRGEDITRGIEPYHTTGYYRTHNYNYVGQGMYLYSYSNKCPYGRYYEKVHDNINNNGELTSLTNEYPVHGADVGHSYYTIAMTHSGIDLNNRAPNGVYNNSMTVTLNYIKLTDFDTPSVLSGAFNSAGENINQAIPAKFSDGYTNTAGQDGVINDVVIHDPISVENCQVIGNQYGAYAPGVKDTSDDDDRIYQREDGTWYQKQNGEKDNYAVVGNEFHVWVSDFGDFYDPSGGWSNNQATTSRGVGGNVAATDVSDKVTGERKSYGSNSTNYRGFQNSMDTNTWIWERLISFSFPVSYVNKAGQTVAVGANTLINLDDVPALTDTGSTGYVTKRIRDGYPVNDTGQNAASGSLFHYGSDKLQSFKGDDDEFVFGLDYAFTVLPSALEDDAGEVTVWARSINTTTDASTLKATNKAKEEINLTRSDGNFKAEDIVSKTMEIDIVGRIGNLVMTDSGDFRYSTLFKRATGSWLINGVIEEVDLKNPKTILATTYDIVKNDTRNLGMSHGTLSATNFLFGDVNGGKSATYTETAKSSNMDPNKGTIWDYLPLVASMNPVKEYQKQQMRMGYLAYMDVETIGNYYGYNFKEGSAIEGIDSIDRGPLSASDPDTRKYVMTILPKYLLYDYSDKTWHGVNIYYGSSGNRELFYSDGEALEGKDPANLYIDLTNETNNQNSERDRRCVTKAEIILTRMVMQKATENGNPDIAHSALESEDYIGTSSKIVLDQFDRNFIGTGYMYGAVTAVNADTNDLHVANSALGSMFNAMTAFDGTTWYLKIDGSNHERVNDLSFTEQSQRWYFSVGLPSSSYLAYPDAGTNQYDVEQSHEQLMHDHPNSVVVCFLDIKVQGDPWALQYNASHVNQGPIKFDLFNPNNLPDNWDSSWDQTIIIDPDNPPPGIPKEWVPVIVYDKEQTSATDWATQGTH